MRFLWGGKMSDVLYKGFKIQKVYTIIESNNDAYDYQFTLKDAKNEIDRLLKARGV